MRMINKIYIKSHFIFAFKVVIILVTGVKGETPGIMWTSAELKNPIAIYWPFLENFADKTFFPMLYTNN